MYPARCCKMAPTRSSCWRLRPRKLLHAVRLPPSFSEGLIAFATLCVTVSRCCQLCIMRWVNMHHICGEHYCPPCMGYKWGTDGAAVLGLPWLMYSMPAIFIPIW